MIALYSFFGDSSLIGKFDVKALQRCTQHLGTAEGQWSTLMLWVPVAMPRAYFPGVDTQCASRIPRRDSPAHIPKHHGDFPVYC